MSWWPVLVQAIVGVLTAVVSFFAVRWGAREVESRSRREEWSRRFFWAADARTAQEPSRRAAGEGALEHLFGSALAEADEKDLLVRVQWAVQEYERKRRLGLDSDDLNPHHRRRDEEAGRS